MVRIRQHRALNHPALVSCLAGMVLMLLAGACAQTPISTAFTSSQFAPDTTLKTSEVSAYLSHFNGVNPEGRGTGTRGFVRAARYVSQRLATYGVQPVVQGEFVRFYVTALNIPRAADLRLYAPDTLILRSGEDIIADGRSRSDSLRFSTLVWRPDSSMDVSGMVVAIPGSTSEEAELRSLVRRGVRAVIIEGTMDTRSYRAPVAGLTAVRVREDALQQLIPGIKNVAGRRRQLPYPVELRVRVEYTPAASAINVMAMIPGADPVLRNELVVIGARLDGFGIAENTQWTDGTDGSVGATSLLEASRILAELQRWSHPLLRTVMIVFWSGSLQDHAGLQAFLRSPPWAVGSIHSVVRILDPAEEGADIKQRVEGAGYRFVSLSSELSVQQGEFQKRQEWYSSNVRNDAVAESGRLVDELIAVTIREARSPRTVRTQSLQTDQ